MVAIYLLSIQWEEEEEEDEVAATAYLLKSIVEHATCFQLSSLLSPPTFALPRASILLVAS